MVSFSERHASLAFGPGDGSWQLAQFGGLNQYKEPFAFMYLDSLLWGGPAFSFRDGVDSGGAMVILGGGTQDVEQQELTNPLLYLWRREVPMSGGAGTFRAGNGIEYALTPIDTEEVIGTLATHGVAIPIRTGIFGGYPGSNARYEVVRGSDVNERMKGGRAVTRLTELKGEHEILPGVSAGVRVRQGDVFNVVLQNGGGYGDPLERDPHRVIADVRTGALDRAWAEKLYGVVWRGGHLDEAATAAHRQEMRQRRLRNMVPPRAASGHARRSGRLPGESWGASLRFAQGDDGVVVRRAHCGGRLGTLGDRWQDLAGTVVLKAEDLGPFVALHPQFHAERTSWR
jgi:N-methylhydantoinase B